jgi:hypothetical protein
MHRPMGVHSVLKKHDLTHTTSEAWFVFYVQPIAMKVCGALLLATTASAFLVLQELKASNLAGLMIG